MSSAAAATEIERANQKLHKLSQRSKNIEQEKWVPQHRKNVKVVFSYSLLSVLGIGKYLKTRGHTSSDTNRKFMNLEEISSDVSLCLSFHSSHK